MTWTLKKLFISLKFSVFQKSTHLNLHCCQTFNPQKFPFNPLWLLINFQSKLHFHIKLFLSNEPLQHFQFHTFKFSSNPPDICKANIAAEFLFDFSLENLQSVHFKEDFSNGVRFTGKSLVFHETQKFPFKGKLIFVEIVTVSEIILFNPRNRNFPRGLTNNERSTLTTWSLTALCSRFRLLYSTAAIEWPGNGAIAIYVNRVKIVKPHRSAFLTPSTLNKSQFFLIELNIGRICRVIFLCFLSVSSHAISEIKHSA